MELEISTSFTFSCSFFNVKIDLEFLLVESTHFGDGFIPCKISFSNVEVFIFLNKNLIKLMSLLIVLSNVKSIYEKII